MRLLLVEEDAELADWLSQSLVGCRSQVEWADDGRIAESPIASEDFDVVLPDLGLPSLSGAELLARHKTKRDGTPDDGDHAGRADAV